MLKTSNIVEIGTYTDSQRRGSRYLYYFLRDRFESFGAAENLTSRFRSMGFRDRVYKFRSTKYSNFDQWDLYSVEVLND